MESLFGSLIFVTLWAALLLILRRQGHFRLNNPFVLFLGLSIFGVFLKLTLLPLARTSEIDHMFAGSAREFLGYALLVYVVYVIAIAVGYFTDGFRRLASRDSTPTMVIRHIDIRTLERITILALLLGIVGAVVYFRIFGISVDAEENLFKKRVFETASGTYAALGHVRVLADLALYVGLFWCLLIFHARRSRRASLYALACFVTYSLIPLVSSTRGPLISMILLVVILSLTFARGGYGKIVGGGFIAVALFVVLGLLRKGQATEGLSAFGTDWLLNDLVFNRYFNGVETLASIIWYYDSSDKWLYGASFIRWIFAPIPRVLWPDKPNTNIGQELGERVFQSGIGTAGGGVPPTFIGELWLNGGLLAVVCGGLVVGVMFRRIFRYLQTSSTPFQRVFAAQLCLNLAFLMQLGSFSQTVFLTLKAALIIWTIDRLVCRRSPQARMLPLNSVGRFNVN